MVDVTGLKLTSNGEDSPIINNRISIPHKIMNKKMMTNLSKAKPLRTNEKSHDLMETFSPSSQSGFSSKLINKKEKLSRNMFTSKNKETIGSNFS